MSDELRVAVLGVGMMGAFHVDALSKRVRGAKVTVVNDFRADKAATKARKSAGVFGRYSTLSLSSRSVTSGCLCMAFSPALSFCTIAGSVPVGTNTPFHS